MNRQIAKLIVIAGMGTGCLTGNSFPENYSSSYCNALFTCVSSDAIELIYDTEEECDLEISSALKDSTTYDSFQEGDMTFNKDKANACIDEVEQMLSDDSCTGDMNIVEFALDSATSACDDVYQSN